MNRQLRLSDGKIKTAYWSLVGVVAALLVSTQAVFAAVIGVSTKTVEAWETGTNQPIGPARRMISLIQFAPEILQSYHIVNENVI